MLAEVLTSNSKSQGCSGPHEAASSQGEKELQEGWKAHSKKVVEDLGLSKIVEVPTVDLSKSS